HGHQLSSRHVPDQCIYVQGPWNHHGADAKACLHAWRNVHNLWFLLTLELFSPRNPAAEFRSHFANSLRSTLLLESCTNQNFNGLFTIRTPRCAKSQKRQFSRARSKPHGLFHTVFHFSVENAEKGMEAILRRLRREGLAGY